MLSQLRSLESESLNHDVTPPPNTHRTCFRTVWRKICWRYMRGHLKPGIIHLVLVALKELRGNKDLIV